ncbi:MAG: RNase adapter RapZ [Pseudomonadota bacterium]
MVVIVTGMSGAGRTTAINAFEDIGYEALNNFPLSMFEALLEPVVGTPAPIAIGIESRTRGFTSRALIETVESLRNRWRAGTALIYLECSDDVLVSRFNQTRRRHPLAPAEDPATGIQRERDILHDIRERADMVIDTTGMTPHELKADLQARFSLELTAGLSLTIQSFSYKRGIPHGADMAIDCRFLNNPYWDDALRSLDGRDPKIQGFVRNDPLFEGFYSKLKDMLMMLLPAYRDEGKAYFTLALGCSGGRHRSVALTEFLSDDLSSNGWPVAVRHRELEQRGRKR